MKSKLEPVMRLSTAIKLGRKRVKKLTEGGDSGFYKGNGDSEEVAKVQVGEGCILTCAALATDSLLQMAKDEPEDELWVRAQQIWSDSARYSCPVSGCSYCCSGIASMAIHVFDSHTMHRNKQMTFDKLTDWIHDNEPFRDPLEKGADV